MLSFGEHATVVAPEKLRERVGRLGGCWLRGMGHEAHSCGVKTPEACRHLISGQCIPQKVRFWSSVDVNGDGAF